MKRGNTPNLIKNNAVVTQELIKMSNEIVGRAKLASHMGKSFGGDRDIYQACGYPTVINFLDYHSKFIRQDIAKRIIRAPVRAVWRMVPDIYEDEDRKNITSFEGSWRDLLRKNNLFHYLSRVDTFAGIGQFAVLLLGFKDGGSLDKECTKASDLLYLQPYNQGAVSIKSYCMDAQNPRYGMPEIYAIQIRKPGSATSNGTALAVHWTRVLHVPSDDVLEDEIYGLPRLECCYNRMIDLESIVAGSAEGVWRSAVPGMSFEADADADLSVQNTAAMEEEIQAYVHDLKRYMKLQGVTAKPLELRLPDPSPAAMTVLKLISGATGIPLRILIGSERGELASSQDDANWNDRITERRTEHVEPLILRPLIDRLLQVGLLNPLQSESEGYTIHWPDVDALSEKEQAEIGRIRSESLRAYSDSQSQDILPPEIFLEDILNFPTPRIKVIMDYIAESIKEEEEEAARLGITVDELDDDTTSEPEIVPTEVE